MSPDLLPAADAAGLPGPVWLFEALLILTFFLHLLFVNLALGGTLLAWLSRLRAGTVNDGPAATLARRLTAVNGYAISLAITTGVAPLLFIQTLYQPLFYSGTILIGTAWLALVGLLIVGYYATYVFKFGGARHGAGGGSWSIGLAALCFLVIAAIHVAVHLVHVQPGGWAGIVRAPWSVLRDPTFVPRWLHFVLAGVGFSALVITWWSVRQARRGSAPALEGAIARTGWRWLVWTTALQIADGFVLLLVLPADVLTGLMRGGAVTMVPLTLGVLGAIGLLVVIARIPDLVAASKTVTVALAGLVGLIAVMVVTRDQVRRLYIGDAVDLAGVSTDPQWLNTALFLVLLVVALATTAWMVRTVLTSAATGSDAA